MYYHFSQNNSGGSFDHDKEQGISHHVIVEADSVDEANARAEEIGLYFDGVDDEIDCPCCGDRWYPLYENEKGSDTPTVYGGDPNDYKDAFFDKGFSVAVHHKNGKIEWF